MRRSKWTHKNSAVAAASTPGADSVRLLEGPVFPSRAPERQAASAWPPGAQKPWLPLSARCSLCGVLSTYLYPWLGIFPFCSCGICGRRLLALLGEPRGLDSWGWGTTGQRGEVSAADEAAAGGQVGGDPVLPESAPSRNVGSGQWKGRDMVWMENVTSPKKFSRVAVNRDFSRPGESLWRPSGCIWPGDSSC